MAHEACSFKEERLAEQPAARIQLWSGHKGVTTFFPVRRFSGRRRVQLKRRTGKNVVTPYQEQ